MVLECRTRETKSSLCGLNPNKSIIALSTDMTIQSSVVDDIYFDKVG